MAATFVATEIPLSPSKAQSLAISLAGVVYVLTLRWCAAMSTWVMNIADSSNAPLISGIPLVTGADLLAQYAYVGIGGKMFVQSDDDTLAPPTFDNLGVNSHLYFVTQPSN